MKILFVCLGNICRSPLAEGIMRNKLLRSNVGIIVDSAGTGGWHSGEHPDKRAIAIAKKYGVDISKQTARKFSVNDFEKFDFIYVMDQQNKNDVLKLAPDTLAEAKVDLLLNVLHPDSNSQVPDPWFGGDDGFVNVYDLLDKACEKLIVKLIPQIKENR